ncbi:unnamed protein product [Ilex paraguariensis]|uniref:Uncharacterized protein n=1 Tax=Ilex paraguariensis TaxID=185542 RepID=A0ABC8TGH4_9AQUA
MLRILRKMLLIIQDGLAKETCIAIFHFSKQKAYAGIKRPHELLPTSVSLTRSGYPRIIPSFHRHLLYKKDDRADQLVKLYFSFFSKSRLVKLSKKVDKTTFSSIVSPTDLVAASSFCAKLREELRPLMERVERGEKRRIFAIENYINQWLLKPVHNWLMSVLRMIPMDGTFDQERLLDYLVGEQHCYSLNKTCGRKTLPSTVRERASNTNQSFEDGLISIIGPGPCCIKILQLNPLTTSLLIGRSNLNLKAQPRPKNEIPRYRRSTFKPIPLPARQGQIPKIEPETHRSFQLEFYPGIDKATFTFIQRLEANMPKTMDFSNLPL